MHCIFGICSYLNQPRLASAQIICWALMEKVLFVPNWPLFYGHIDVLISSYTSPCISSITLIFRYNYDLTITCTLYIIVSFTMVILISKRFFCRSRDGLCVVVWMYINYYHSYFFNFNVTLSTLTIIMIQNKFTLHNLVIKYGHVGLTRKYIINYDYFHASSFIQWCNGSAILGAPRWPPVLGYDNT